MNKVREFKFRAWDKEANCLLDEWMLSQDYSYMIPGEIVNLNHLVQVYDLNIMQFTGFYDSNGKEVYEGDVLISQLFIEGVDEETFAVYFERGGFCLSEFPQAESGGNVFYRNWFTKSENKDLPQPACNYRVVGHIYEPAERIEERLMGIKDELNLDAQNAS